MNVGSTASAAILHQTPNVSGTGIAAEQIEKAITAHRQEHAEKATRSSETLGNKVNISA